MNLKEAELLCRAGALEIPVIRKHGQGEGWTVTLIGKHNLNPMLETARGQVRIFKRLDVAVELLFDMGIAEIKTVQ